MYHSLFICRMLMYETTSMSSLNRLQYLFEENLFDKNYDLGILAKQLPH